MKYKTICALLLLFSLDTAFASGYAIADGDTARAWSKSTTQAKAEKDALAECNKIEPKKNCKLTGIYGAFVRAEGGGHQGWNIGKDLPEASDSALKSCGNDKCLVKWSTAEPGFFALALAKNKDGSTKYAHTQFGDVNYDVAKKLAISKCEKKSRIKCELAGSGAIHGSDVEVAEANQNIQPDPTKGSCRPNTASIKCSSNCVNGNCTITYENGCKVRVQVSPKLDPFSNQWTYPSPSC